MDETDYRYGRCIRNERKLDNLEMKVDNNGDKLLKLDVKLDRVITNDLAHVPTYEEVPSKRDFKIAIIAAGSSIIIAILTNLDKIESFIRTCLGG